LYLIKPSRNLACIFRILFHIETLILINEYVIEMLLRTKPQGIFRNLINYLYWEWLLNVLIFILVITGNSPILTFVKSICIWLDFLIIREAYTFLCKEEHWNFHLKVIFFDKLFSIKLVAYNIFSTHSIMYFKINLINHAQIFPNPNAQVVGFRLQMANN